MNKRDTDVRVSAIEAASGFACLRYRGLRKNASATNQAEALRGDCEWLRDHTEELCSEFDRLVRDMEGPA